MKKVVSLILALCIVLSFCACSGSEGDSNTDNPEKTNKATITDNEGNTVQLSAKEICEIYSENSFIYEAKYLGAAATISGTVYSVRSGYISDSVRIRLQENWIIEVSEFAHPEVVNLTRGQKIKITAPLGRPEFMEATMDGILDVDGVGYKDVAAIQIIE